MKGGVQTFIRAGLIIFCAAQVCAWAQVEDEGLENFDRRGEVAHPAVDAAAVKRLTARVPDAGVTYDRKTGAPNYVASTRGFLTGRRGSGRAVSAAVADAIPASDANRPIKAFLNDHRALFGHGGEVIATSRVQREDVSHGGVRTLAWQQLLDGIPVFEGLLRANVTRDGELINIGSDYVPQPEAAADRGTKNRRGAEAAPTISARQAVARAAKNIEVEVQPADLKAEDAKAEGGAERRQRFTHRALSDISARLTWLPWKADSMRLCWEVTLMNKVRSLMYRVLIDAENGEPLVRHSLTADVSPASYRVFTSDSPTPFSPGWSAPNSAQPPAVAQTLVTLSAINPAASPNGWMDDGVNETLGNNVDAHLDLNADNVADLPRPQGSPNRVFDFALDLAQAPSTAANRNASVVQLFYWCNFMHDKLYALGFTESAGNFQNNNFGKGGTGNDAVQADAQDGAGTNNANFSTPSDGSPGRMQMFIFTAPAPQRDGSFDADVVLHEYTHGLSNRLVGNGIGISALQTRGMGEGWSDFYALSLLSESGDDVNGNYAAGGYASYLLNGNSQSYYFGIRRYPYTTNLAKNPLTFKDIDPAQMNPHTGVPSGPVGSTGSEVHAQGEVWCVTLWDARANLINKYGWATGNQLMLQLVTDGMKLGPANPTFLQARDAIIQADLVANGGANKNELWAAFAKRGMGASATSPASSTTTSVQEAFDVPDNLNVTPAAVFTASGQVGGPFIPTAQTYTLTNNGASSLNWSAASSQTWLAVAPTAGTLAPGTSTTVTASLTAAANALTGSTYYAAATFTNLASGAAIVRQASLAITPPRIAFFDFTTDPGWTRQGEWAFGKPTGGGGTAHGFHDPTTGATGNNVFGINLNGDYSTTTISGPFYLTTSAINLTGYIGTQLRFKRWLNADYPSYIYETVDVSSDGTNWTSLFANTSGVEIAESAWSTQTYPLGAAFDNKPTVYVRWGHRVGSSGAFAYSGWNVDDVEFLGSPQTGLTLTLSAATAVEGSSPVTATLKINPVPTVETIVAVNNSDPASVNVPATATFAAGQSTVTFPVEIVDDAIVNGSRSVLLTASKSGYSSASATLLVDDNETAGLSVTAPATATEGGGVVSGAVTINPAPAASVVVSLSSSDVTALTVPASITIPAGQSSANFNIGIVDDTKINGTHSATITAHVNGWTDGSASISIADNESNALSFSLPASVTEGSSSTASVVVAGALSSSLAVSLSSADATRLTVPASVTIPAGASFATFTMVAPNNALVEGTQNVTITASASGFTSVSGSTPVLDNDVHHFAISSIATAQVKGVAFAVTITAKDLNNVTITSYTGSPSLSASGSAGSVAITPVSVITFASGVWTGNVTANAFDTSVTLTVSDGAGHTGTSNVFNLSYGALDHFTWSAVPTPQSTGVPFAATVLAKDAANNTVGNFAGTATLSAFSGNPLASGVVISEINPNTPDEIEFTNVGNTAVDVSGWTVYIYDVDVWPTAKSFTIPAGTTCAAGAIFRLQEYGTAPGTYPVFYYGDNVNWTSDAGVPIAVLLRNAAGTAVDFACAAGGTPASISVPQTIPATQWSGATVTAPSNAAYGYARIGNSDTNVATNWTTATPGLGTINPGLTVPFPSASIALGIAPTATGAFSNGAWTGNLSVTQTSSQAQLRASDSAGHLGDSNAFAVNATAILSITPSSGLSASGNFGGPFGPDTATYTLANGGTGALNWTATKSAAWLTLSPASGTLAAGSTVNVSATINAGANALSPGGYSDTVSFTNSTSGVGNTTRSAALTILPPVPVIAAEPSFTGGSTNTLSWASVAGADSYEAQSSAGLGFATPTSSGWMAETNYAFTGLSHATLYAYRVRARWTATGSTSAWSSVVTSTQDNVPPAVVITAPANASSIGSSTVSLQGTASDLSGISSLTVNGTVASTADGFAHWTATASGLHLGPNTVNVLAKDNAAPFNASTTPLALTGTAPADLNHNGLPDDWEATYGITDGPNGDLDKDGLSNLLEYALGTHPGQADSTQLPSAALQINPADNLPYLVFTYRQRLADLGLTYTVLLSHDLSTWTPAGASVELVAPPTQNADGVTQTIRLRVLPSIAAPAFEKTLLKLNVTAP